MTGFLRRVAASVVEGRAVMHPFVESSYAFTPRAAELAAPGAEVSAFAIRGGESEPLARGAHHEDAGRQAGSPAPRLAPVLPAQDAGAPASGPSRFRPLFPSFSAAPTTTREAETDGSPLVPSPTRGASARADGKRPLDAKGPRPVSPFASDDALRSDDAAPGVANPSEATRTNVSFSSEAGPRAALRDATFGARAAPRSDEVQIHIGRIEVFAVPPPAPRTVVAAPARKGLSLDEYLRRKGTTGAGR